MKKYLITGCAGFIGSNFVHYMLKKYPEILLVNLDKLTYAGNLENLKDVEGDPRHVFVMIQHQYGFHQHDKYLRRTSHLRSGSFVLPVSHS